MAFIVLYQSILKEINPKYSLEGLMLKLQYFGHLMWRADSLEKTLMLGKIEGRKTADWKNEGDSRGWDGWMASPTRWTRVWASSGSLWWRGKPGVLLSMGLQRTRPQWLNNSIDSFVFNGLTSIPSLDNELQVIRIVTVSLTSANLHKYLLVKWKNKRRKWISFPLLLFFFP